VFAPLFRQQVSLIQNAFQDVSSKDQKQLQKLLKKVGKRAEALAKVEKSDGGPTRRSTSASS
jgi:ABC-type phosphate/phosphonate transport system ATPase subunit